MPFFLAILMIMHLEFYENWSGKWGQVREFLWKQISGNPAHSGSHIMPLSNKKGWFPCTKSFLSRSNHDFNFGFCLRPFVELAWLTILSLHSWFSSNAIHITVHVSFVFSIWSIRFKLTTVCVSLWNMSMVESYFIIFQKSGFFQRNGLNSMEPKLSRLLDTCTRITLYIGIWRCKIGSFIMEFKLFCFFKILLWIN